MAYADATTLGSKLKVNPSTYSADLDRVLNAAALEIDHELGGTIVSPTTEEAALLESVNLGRAQDLWLVEGLPVGVIGLGGETPLLAPRDSWARWANVLAALKPGDAWGVA